MKKLLKIIKIIILGILARLLIIIAFPLIGLVLITKSDEKIYNYLDNMTKFRLN